MQRARTLSLAASALALSVSLCALGSPVRVNERINDHERAVHHLVTAYFSGLDAAHLQQSLADSLADADGDVPGSLKSLADALTKLQADGERGLGRYKEKDFVFFARTVAYSDVAVARSALTRLQTALEGRALSAATKELLSQMTARLSDIYTAMGGEE